MPRQFPTSAAIQPVAPGRARVRSADDYRRRACECQELAARTADPYHRQILEQMAADWLSLVRDAEADLSPFLTEIGQKIG